MNPYNFSILLFSSWMLIVGVFIWVKYHDEVAKAYFVFSLWVTGWGMPFAFMISNNISEADALFVGRIANASAVLIGPAWYHFTLKYTGSRRQNFSLLFYGLALAIVLGAFSPWFMPGVRPSYPFPHYPVPGPLYHLFFVLFGTTVVLGFLELCKKIDSSEGYEKIKTRNLAIAALIGFTGGSLSFLPVYKILVPQHTIFLMPIYPFIIGYLLTRQKLFDIEELALAAQRNKLETLGILSASINHELKNPIYIVRTLADSFLLRMKAKEFEDNEKGGLQNAVETCEKTILHADRAMDIVRRLTNFTKQEAKDAPMQAVDVRKILEDVYLFLRYDIQISNIQLSWDIADDFPKIYGQPRYLEQIFFNLVVNACQAIKKFKKNEGSIKITGKKLPAAVQITIEDNGPGISKDILPKIFEPFYTTKETGTGLGLYITKQLVEKNGGTITVASQLDQTTFTLKFQC